MGAATEFAVLLEDAVWRADAEATAPAIAHVHLRRALGDDAGTTTVIAWGSLAFYIFNF